MGGTGGSSHLHLGSRLIISYICYRLTAGWCACARDMLRNRIMYPAAFILILIIVP